MLRVILRRSELAEPRAHLMRALLEDLPDDHAGARRDRGPAVRHARRVRLCDLHELVGHAERVGDDLRVHRARALPDLRTPGRDPHAGGRELEPRARLEIALAAPRESRAMVEEREADRPVGAFVLTALAVEVGAAHRLLEDQMGAAVVAERLARGSGVAGPQCVLPPELHRVHPQRLGDALHLHLHRELRLRRAEAAEGAVGRRVREDRAPVDRDVVAAVRTGRVDAAARQHHRTQRDIGTAIEEHVDLHRHQATVARDARPVPHDRGMPLGRGDHVLDAIVDDLHRPTRLEREERRVPRRDRGELLLAAEAAAGLRLDHSGRVRRAEERLERLERVEGTLDRAMDRDAAILRHRDHPVGLDVDVLLVAGVIRALDHDIRARHRRGGVTLGDRDPLELLRGPRGVKERGLLLVLDDHARRMKRLLVRVRQQEDRFADVPDLAFDEEGLVMLDEVHDLRARHVAVVHDREAGGIEVEQDRADAAAGDRRADGATVEHPGEGDVIRVQRGTGGLADAVLAGDAVADGRRYHLRDLAGVRGRAVGPMYGARLRVGNPGTAITRQLTRSSHPTTSNPASKLITRGISRRCMIATWSASRAERRASPIMTSRARCTSAASMG